MNQLIFQKLTHKVISNVNVNSLELAGTKPLVIRLLLGTLLARRLLFGLGEFDKLLVNPRARWSCIALAKVQLTSLTVPDDARGTAIY